MKPSLRVMETAEFCCNAPGAALKNLSIEDKQLDSTNNDDHTKEADILRTHLDWHLTHDKATKYNLSKESLENHPPESGKLLKQDDLKSTENHIPKYDSNSKCRCSETKPEYPEGGWGWVVLIASFFVNMIADGVSYSFGVIYTEFLDYFRLDHGTTAWIGGIFISLPLLSGPVASYMIDKYGCRKMTMLGSVLACAGFIISSVTDSFTVLCMTFGIIAGSGLSLCYISSVVIVANYFDKRRSFAIGLALSGSGIGTLIFAPYIELLLGSYGWRGTTLILAGFFLNLAVCGALMRDPPWVVKSLKLAKKRKHLEGNKTKACQNKFEDKDKRTGRLSNENLSKPAPKENNCNMKIQKETAHMEENKNIEERLSNKPCLKPHLLTSLNFSSVGRLQDLGRQELFFMHKRPLITLSTNSLSCPNIHGHSAPPTLENAKNHQASVGNCQYLHKSDRFSYFKNAKFFVYALSNFILYTWYDVPYVYLKDYALQKHHSAMQSSSLISLVGVFNMMGQIMLGWIGDRTWANCIVTYALCMISCGTLIGLTPLTTSYIMLCIISSGFGLFVASNYALACVILVDIVTLKHITYAFGFIYMVQGVGNLIGPPIGGWLYDFTGTYNLSFYFTGLFIAISGLILLVLPILELFKSSKCRRQGSSLEEEQISTKLS